MNSQYDDESFFEAYSDMPRSKGGLAAAGEWRRLEPLLPDLSGKKVLDLGCGFGWHCKYAAAHGAKEVIGLDSSEKMLARAKAINGDARIRYRLGSLESFDFSGEAFDLALSNLALHYVRELEPVYRRVYAALKPGGSFVFNIEHPCFTAAPRQQWITDSEGRALYWPVDNYYFPGERETVFLRQKVMKYHHTLTQILNPLPALGFRLTAVIEAEPPESMRGLPGMADEMRRPMMLLVSAQKE